MGIERGGVKREERERLSWVAFPEQKELPIVSEHGVLIEKEQWNYELFVSLSYAFTRGFIMNQTCLHCAFGR